MNTAPQLFFTLKSDHFFFFLKYINVPKSSLCIALLIIKHRCSSLLPYRTLLTQQWSVNNLILSAFALLSVWTPCVQFLLPYGMRISLSCLTQNADFILLQHLQPWVVEQKGYSEKVMYKCSSVSMQTALCI